MTFLEAISFRPLPVTLLAVATYISLLTGLLWVHLVPPKVAPQFELNRWGVNLTDAWQDLRQITGEFHPYNAHSNDNVRDFLLKRITDIVKENQVNGYDGEIEIVDDNSSNVLFEGGNANGLTVYFEGTNIMVLVRGTDTTLSPVLVNAHYDSVSTGYGATDDGMAVVTVLQLVKAFTNPSRAGEHRVQRGILALLNNGEEDFLNGARAFAVHPMGKLAHSFLNLEGAGAGGRATLFRSTDAEVTKWYKASKRPFGTVVSGDGFKSGLVKSQTDYKVFTENLGMRGLDVAFWEPRSRYHTVDDDVKHTTRRSLWHMLGSSLEILEAATRDTGREFDHEEGPPAGVGHDGVWFDLFGRAFGLLRLHTLFALTITLIIVPVIMMATTVYFLHISGKFYYLSNTPLIPQPPDESHLPRTTRGWRGLFRFPVAFVVASAAVVGMAYLVDKINPMIAYSSQFSVWAMFLSLWWCFAWFVLRGADADTVRPTALGRGYAFIEQWALWWVVLIAVAVSIDQSHLASGYFVLVSYTGVFLAAWLSLLELFGLPRKTSPLVGYEPIHSEGHSQISPSGPVSDDEDSEPEANERTHLFRGERRPTTFGGFARRDTDAHSFHSLAESDLHIHGVFGREQAWSAWLPTWIWIPQFLFSVPVPLIFTTSIGLLLSTATNQTGADGSSTLTIYLIMAIMSILTLLPGSPFYHRISYQITLLLFIICIATTTYNLSAFPFTDSSRLKVYFQQSVNLDTGINSAYLVAHPAYVDSIVSSLPSSQGAPLNITSDPSRVGLKRISWPGIPPKVAGNTPMSSWLETNTTKLSATSARIYIRGLNTRACKLNFPSPVSRIVINRPGVQNLGEPIGPQGTKEIRLWSREWEKGWEVDVEWEDSGVDRVRATCIWSDANNAREEIPALWEVERFMPRWSVVSKLADGLVEGWREVRI
ncbi:hypothetical protein BZA77DRAFT_391091 [Pyronema omphalodes]|nr:hypothetical protein BZA77DRAFT_391091 [Pyronema omphalodes]